MLTHSLAQEYLETFTDMPRQGRPRTSRIPSLRLKTGMELAHIVQEHQHREPFDFDFGDGAPGGCLETRGNKI